MAGLMMLTSWSPRASIELPGDREHPTSFRHGTIVSMNDNQVVIKTAMVRKSYRLSTSVDRTGMTVETRSPSGMTLQPRLASADGDANGARRRFADDSPDGQHRR
jgi:hypothetical protein